MWVWVLIVEERATHALALADGVAVMSLGHVSWSGTPEELDGERLAAVYLGGQDERYRPVDHIESEDMDWIRRGEGTDRERTDS